MQALFISYRRSDSEAYTGRLYDRLVAQFGKDLIFKDVDSIPLGTDFRTHLNAVIGQCQAVLAVVGTHWVDACDPAGSRRLENSDDFVRIELEAALARDVPVIPVLVAGAAMPTTAQLPASLAQFAYRQGTTVRPDPDFHRDMDRLVASLEPLLGSALAPPANAEREAIIRTAAAAAAPTPAAGPPTTSTRRSNLPRNLPSLLGRAELVAQVVGDLDEHALITLAGFGGVGKTRLAQQVGAEVAERFADGAWFVDLAGLKTDAEVVPSIARTLGVREHSSEPLSVTLIAALRDRQMLLILDNCERLVECVAAFVEEAMASSTKVKFLNTSRTPLGVYGERIVRVSGLERAAAIALFTARAAEARGGLSADPVVAGELCRRLDDVPLAIELAAAHVRSLTPAEILARVSERFSVLRATDRRTARHQTLEALVAWSYDLLTGQEQRLLNRLSVFVGSFDLVSTERMCAGTGIDAHDVVHLLDRLVDKSLVSASTAAGATRFRMMDTVQQFAAHKLELAGEQDEMFERHTGHFSKQAQSLGDRIRSSETRATSTALLFEIDNLNAAIERLGSRGQHTDKARLVVALNLFWQTAAPGKGRVRYEELMKVLDQIEVDVRFLTVLEAASFFQCLGFATQAVRLLERVRETAAAHAIELPSYFYYVAAAVAEMDSRPEEVLAMCEAGDLVQQPGDDFAFLSLRARALTSILKLRPQEALEHASATLRHAESSGMDLFVSVAHMLIGTVHALSGRIDEGEPELVRAIEMAGEAMPQVTIGALVASAAGYRLVDPQRSMRRAHETLDIEAQTDIMPLLRVVAADILAWHWARGEHAEDAVLLLSAMDELRVRMGFRGIWWAQGIHKEAWDAARAGLPAVRVTELTARGKSLTVAEVRRLLASPRSPGQ